MTAFKNQHFVPQMYLRLFADADGRRIGVLPLSNGELVRTAGIRDQASCAWFYGRDGAVESDLSTIESETARIIAETLDRNRPPVRLSADHQGLAMFISLQHQRTQAAADEVDERADKVVKSLLRESMPGHAMLSRLDGMKVSMTDPIAEALRAGFLGTPMLYDLRMKLVINTSGRPFIASDAPVVLHNRLYEETDAPAEGFGNAGLQIIMPLGPWRALLLCDADAYHVGSAASACVRLINPSHADLVNDLQLEAARSVIFASPEAEDTVLHDAWRRWRLRQKGRITIDHTVIEQDGRTKHTRLGVGARPSGVKLGLPFVRMRSLGTGEPIRGSDIPNGWNMS